MNYSLTMYHRQKPIAKKDLRFRQAMAFFENLLIGLRKDGVPKERITNVLNNVKYHQMPEMTQAKKRVLKMV